MSALTNYFTSLANKIRSKTGKSTTMTPNDMITEVDAVYQAGVESVPTPVTQSKTVTAGTSATTVTPDSGKLLSSVTVNPTPSQSKTAPAAPNGLSYANGNTITPDSGKLLSSVTIPKPFGGDAKNFFFGSIKTETVTMSSCLYTFPSNDVGGIYLFAFATRAYSMGIGQVNGVSILNASNSSLKWTSTDGSTSVTTPCFYIVKLATASNPSIRITSVGAGTSQYIMVRIAGP